MSPYDLIQIPCKLTLPVGRPTEITLPQLATYTDPWFHLNPTNDGVVFTARTDGAHTSGSKNPRCEPREMKADGSPAAWSSTAGAHSMEVELSVDVLPIGKKPHVVIAQIHDASDDITVFRVEGNFVGSVYGSNQYATIWITNGNTTHDTGSTPGHKLTDNYHLGDKIRVGFQVSGGQIRYTFNGQSVDYMQTKSVSGCYFKTGCYNQSGGIITKLADGSADYAQVTLYAVQVCHDGICTGNAPGAGVTVDPPVVIDPPLVPPVTVDPLYQAIIDGLNTSNAALVSASVGIQNVLDKLMGLKL